MVNGGATYRDEQAVAVGLADSVCEPAEISACAIGLRESTPHDSRESFQDHQTARSHARTDKRQVQAEREFGDQILADRGIPRKFAA